jgi:hypothetical protein
MCAISDNFLPDTYFALCKDDGHFYIYNKTNPVNEVTGRFTIISEVVEPMIINIDGGEILE